jgi:hypothetical protein
MKIFATILAILAGGYGIWMVSHSHPEVKNKVASILDMGNFHTLRSPLQRRPDHEQAPEKSSQRHSESVCGLSFCRFLGSFEPIFDSNLGDNINLRILSLKFESKIGQNNPKNRRSLNSQTDSNSKVQIMVAQVDLFEMQQPLYLDRE